MMKYDPVANFAQQSIEIIGYSISSYSFRGKLFFFEFGNPKVTVHKAKGHST